MPNTQFKGDKKVYLASVLEFSVCETCADIMADMCGRGRVLRMMLRKQRQVEPGTKENQKAPSATFSGCTQPQLTVCFTKLSVSHARQDDNQD